MKHLLLIAAIFTASFSSVYAGNGPTQSANDSTIKAIRSTLTTKVNQLQAAYSSNAASQSAVQATDDVKNLMRNGMQQTLYSFEFETDVTKKQALKARYLSMEQSSFSFYKLSGNPAANHIELLKQAQAFSSKF